MPAAYTDLFLEQGADFSTTLTLDDAYGNIYDLNNYIAASFVKTSYYTKNITAEFTVTIPDTTQGIILLQLDSANTANIQSGRYVYDVLLKDSGTITRVLEGVVNVNPQVTRW